MSAQKNSRPNAGPNAGPIKLCVRCQAGQHSDCMRGAGPHSEPCNCPECWSQGQDVVSAFSARRKLHPRLRVPVGRKGAKGILDRRIDSGGVNDGGGKGV